MFKSKKTSSRFLLLISFVSGFAIMAMEISASRLLAPYFGTSLFVWTNIIGIVLIALSLGYYFGGKLADKSPKVEVLLKLILLAGLFFSIIPWIIKPLTSLVDINSMAVESSSMIIFVSSLIVTTLLFSLPLFLLGMVSPFIIKLYSITQEDRIGELAGNIFAISTLGSILGTFLPTLYFIPILGTRLTINIFASTLIILGSFSFLKRKIYFFIFITLALLAFYPAKASIKNSDDLIFEDESAYQYIRVNEDYDGIRYLSFNEGGGVQSVYDKNNILTGMYYDYFNVLPYLLDSNKDNKSLIIGLAGGTIANQLNYFFKEDISVEGVEIDQKVIDIAKEYFGLDDTTTKIHNQDGRMFLRNDSNKHDLIIVDAYQQEIYIPWTLTTKEFWELIEKRLNNGGIVSMNVNSISTESDLLKIISNTISSVFEHTYITKIEEDGWNYMITASNTALDFKNLENRTNNKDLKPLGAILSTETKKINFDSNVMVLSDDLAPIEFMTEKMALDYVKELYK